MSDGDIVLMTVLFSVASFAVGGIAGYLYGRADAWPRYARKLAEATRAYNADLAQRQDEVALLRELLDEAMRRLPPEEPPA